MLDAVAAPLREGLSASVAVGVLLAAARRRGMRDDGVFGGAALGLALSLFLEPWQGWWLALGAGALLALRPGALAPAVAAAVVARSSAAAADLVANASAGVPSLALVAGAAVAVLGLAALAAAVATRGAAVSEARFRWLAAAVGVSLSAPAPWSLLPLALVAWPEHAALPEARGPARRQAVAARAAQWRAAAIIAAVALTALSLAPARPLALDAPVLLSPAAGRVRVPLAAIADGRLHRFAVATPAAVVRFIVVLRPDGRPALGLDACEICRDAGYVEADGGVMCLRCTAPINIDSIGMAGGCNPLPVRWTTRDGAIEIRVEDLAEGGRWFIPEGGRTAHACCSG